MGIAGCLVTITFLSIWLTRSRQGHVVHPTPVLIVVKAPTATLPLPTALPTDIINPTATSLPGIPGGEVAQGAYVQIVNTGGSGLRVRSEAGLQGEVLFLALEDEVFQVIDGPRQVDGYTWWYLVAPYNNELSGWAVADYLAVIQNP